MWCISAHMCTQLLLLKGSVIRLVIAVLPVSALSDSSCPWNGFAWITPQCITQEEMRKSRAYRDYNVDLNTFLVLILYSQDYGAYIMTHCILQELSLCTVHVGPSWQHFNSKPNVPWSSCLYGGICTLQHPFSYFFSVFIFKAFQCS